MSQSELLIKAVTALNALKIPYMVTGSWAASFMGHIRSTHDIDIVLSLPIGLVKKLVATFPEPEFMVQEEVARDAVLKKRMFTVMECATGDKLDFWMLKDDDFNRELFARRTPIAFNGEQVFTATPEDVILSKLKWAIDSGGSEKQYTDALRVYEFQKDELNESYLIAQARKLGLIQLLDRIKKDARPL